MRFRYFATLCAVLAATIAGSSSAQGAEPVTVPFSEQFELKNAKGHVYRICVALPRGEMPAGGYASLYVLDANAFFLTAVEAVRFQKGLTPALVIGIGYPTEKPLDVDRRYWDYTPVTDPEKLRSPNEPPVKPGGTGGQDELIAFIEDVLKPEIAKRHKLDPAKRAIWGHSLAGRFVLHTMFTKPKTFDAYLAASPSIWWDDKSILNEQEAFLKSPDAKKVRVLLTTAEFEQNLAPGTPPERAEFLTKARMVDNAREMFGTLSAAKVKASFVEFPEENHGTVVPGAISRGVKFAFAEPPKPATTPPAAKP